MNPFLRLLLLLLIVLSGLPAISHAEQQLVVIVHPGSGVDRLTRTEVTNIFLGRFRQLPSGLKAMPFDVTAHRDAFYLALVGRTPAEINAYWARLKFSGRTTPPPQVDEAAALARVASDTGAIAYVDRKAVDGRVKIVFVVEP